MLSHRHEDSHGAQEHRYRGQRNHKLDMSLHGTSTATRKAAKLYNALQLLLDSAFYLMTQA